MNRVNSGRLASARAFHRSVSSAGPVWKSMWVEAADVVTTTVVVGAGGSVVVDGRGTIPASSLNPPVRMRMVSSEKGEDADGSRRSRPP